MTRTLFRRNLGHHALLLGAIATGVFLFEVFLVWVVAQMDTGAGLEAFLGSVLPPAMSEVLFERFGVASFPGAVAFGYQHPFTLIGGIAFVIVAATIPAAERESGLLDLILARPVPRSRYLAASGGLLVVGAVVTALAVLVGAAVGIAVAGGGHPDVRWTAYLPATALLAGLFLAIGGYSLLLGSASPRRGPAVARAAGVTLGFYWLDFIGGLWEPLATARRASPFAYFDPAGAAVDGGAYTGDLVVLLAVGGLASAIAFRSFRRQEL